jgi:hypothetical protein
MIPTRSGASRAHEVDDVAALPAERGVGGQHPFDEATPRHGMRSVADLPLDDGVTNRLFSAIVRWFDPSK